jgi:hypothetical protein
MTWFALTLKLNYNLSDLIRIFITRGVTFFNKADLPLVKLIWSQYYSNRKVPGIVTKGGFWWRNIVKLLNTYKGIAQAELGYGILSFYGLICEMEES